MNDLARKLTRVLHKELPGLLEADVESSARAAAQVSNLLGCIMATVLMRRGPAAYASAMRTVIEHINKAAFDTAAKAKEGLH